jgi:hypothetical protein
MSAPEVRGAPNGSETNVPGNASIQPDGAASVTDAATPGSVSANTELLMDPAISRAKFAREVNTFQQMSADHVRRGWWLLHAEFPNVLMAFTAPQLKPRAVVFGALINFDNYDLWAPSVRLVDPFTAKPLFAKEIPAALAFTRRVAVAAPPVEIPGIGMFPGYVEQPLLVTHGPDELPFLCIPGVREYHDHPAHTGDDWLLHRGGAEGTLHFLVEQLSRYGLEPIQQYQIGLSITGYARGEAPT